MDSIITVKTAQRAAQAARAAAKAAVVTVKAIAKATALAIKAIIAGTKALIATIAAGGWVAVLVIIVICLIGMILGSVFGIFFSKGGILLLIWNGKKRKIRKRETMQKDTGKNAWNICRKGQACHWQNGRRK